MVGEDHDDHHARVFSRSGKTKSVLPALRESLERRLGLFARCKNRLEHFLALLLVTVITFLFEQSVRSWRRRGGSRRVARHSWPAATDEILDRVELLCEHEETGLGLVETLPAGTQKQTLSFVVARNKTSS